jgi:hypothetical protein
MRQSQRTQDFGKLVKRIERSNAKFEKATQAQRIVMVANDVLALLSLKRITAVSGTYVELPSFYNEADSLPTTESNTCQLQDVLKMPTLPTCSVCAIGGAMLVSTMRLNRVQVSKDDLMSGGDWGGLNIGYDNCEDDDVDSTMSNRTREVFPDKLLREMEQAFECTSYGYHRLSSANGLLKAIYQNLVDNKGEKFTWYKNPDKVVFQVEG